MTIVEALRRRSSIRAFDARPVGVATIDRVLSAALEELVIAPQELTRAETGRDNPDRVIATGPKTERAAPQKARLASRNERTS